MPDTNQEGGVEQRKVPDFNLRSTAFEVGFSIAMPIVVFALLGRFLDKHFDTAPFLLLGGIFFSIIISSILVFRKMKRYF